MEQYHLNNAHMSEPLVLKDISVYQSGTLYCKPNTISETHNQMNRFELTIVTDGEGYVFTNGDRVAVKRNDIYLSFPCDTHAIESSFINPLKFNFFAFSTTDESLNAELDAVMQNYMAADKRIFKDERVAPLVDSIISEMTDTSFMKDESLYNLSYLVIIYILRAFKAHKRGKHPKYITDSTALCHSLMRYMDTHIYSMKTLNDLSDFSGYNYSYLSARFKKSTGLSLSDYFSAKKLETAKQLIADSGLTISKISELLNYSSLYAFSKAFHNKFNISPREYKNLVSVRTQDNE